MQIENIFRIESRTDAPEAREASNHQPGSDKQHKSHRQLHYDKNILSASFGGACATASFLQCFLHIWPRGSQRWGESKDNTGEQRNRQRKEEHAPVQSDFFS